MSENEHHTRAKSRLHNGTNNYLTEQGAPEHILTYVKEAVA